MRRQENHPARPTTGLSVPLFNQKKRNRVPLTSVPSDNEFFSHSQYAASSSSAAPHSTSGTHGCYQASGLSPSVPPQSLQWNRPGIQQSTLPQQYGSNRPAPGPAPTVRTYAPIQHPYKARDTSLKVEQPSNPMRKGDLGPSVNSGQSKYQALHISESAQIKPKTHTGSSQMGQQSSCRPPNPTHQYFQQPRPLPAAVPPPSKPSAHADQPQTKSWKFTNSFGPQRSTSEGNKSSKPPQTAHQTQQEGFPLKPDVENSLRILTSVIGGMRHWSQFKDKVPYLFEIFATLDSAVTLGPHGAKRFLMRDGKEVVSCIYYETEQELPRLIRGQVHRCVGNYDLRRDVLMCVSVRPGLPSELRNAQEAVKVCDAEMRTLVRVLSEA